ncbi:MAG: M60 family metallopeptidase [Verrucomicrobiales bacterium]|nr:M60 family metallopeptidase [Verrucomicrobiales bacterium]
MKYAVLCSLLAFAVLSSRADESVRQLILGDGGTIDLKNSVPGKIDLTTDAAFPLITDDKGGIVAAGATSGKGRVVGFTHGGFLKPGGLLSQETVRTLVWNAIRWAGRGSEASVGLHPGLAGLQGALEEAGFDVKVFPPEEKRDHEFSVYCVIGHEKLSEGDIVKLYEFVQDGGGLVISTTPWAFKKRHDPFSEFPGNKLLANSGIQFLPDGYAGRGKLVIGEQEPMSPARITPMGRKAAVAVEKLLIERTALSDAEVESLATDLLEAKDFTGSVLESFLVKLKELNEAVGPIVPTKENPVVPGADPLVDTILELETHFNETAPAGVMYAIPAAADYPGAIPKESERVTHTFSMDGVYRGWLEGRNAAGWAAKEMRPTGIYAPPGEVITVTLPARLGGEGFEVVIGSYGGKLKNRDKWHRYTDWQVTRPVRRSKTEISSGLGGLVTIRIPHKADYEEIEVTIEGGVRAPLYQHGKTDLKEWVNEIRKYPAPWAELASDRMIVAVPSEYIRNLKDPDKVMEIWNGFIDKAAELVQVDRDDYRAERIVFDRQTAAGSMHSSYPVAAHLGGAAEQAVDAEKLKEGNWGFFHEYGHNHQHNLWALPRTGETTCNLWSVYLYEEYVGKDRDETHGAIRPLNRKQRINAYFNQPTSFESDWSVWTALETYLMIQEEFGWEPFQKVFDEYNRLEPSERPRGQQEINDQWVIRLSRACGMNLQPFWATWKLPMTEKVERALQDLPVWEDHPVARWAPKGRVGEPGL